MSLLFKLQTPTGIYHLQSRECLYVVAMVYQNVGSQNLSKFPNFHSFGWTNNLCFTLCLVCKKLNVTIT